MSNKAGTKSKYEVLKELLMADELAQQKELDRELKNLRDEVREKQKLEQNIEPVIAERLMQFKRDFPREFGPALARTIREQTEENEPAMMEALAPIVNKLIKKYFSEKVNGLKNLVWAGKRPPQKDPTDLYKDNSFLSTEDQGSATLNDIFVLENEHLELLGHHSKYSSDADGDIQEVIFKDIRQTLRDNLDNKERGLEWFQQHSYNVYLISFKRISVACTVSGTPDRRYKSDLEDQVMEFAKDVLPELEPGDPAYNKKLTQRFLENHFQQL